MTHSFNLVDRPWLPVVRPEGTTAEVGIEEALVEAHELAVLRDGSPLTTVALLRLLLAVLHASLEGPDSLDAWTALWRSRRWPAGNVRAYLAEWKGRFDLFDSKHPFFQVAGFTVEGKDPAPISKLWMERASGNNPTLFDHTVEERPLVVTPAEAARALVTTQAFALGGGVGATSNSFGKHPNLTHSPMIGGVAVMLHGATLFETLALNLLVRDRHGPIPSEKTDRPTWERSQVAPPGDRVPSGYLEYLTWRSRMVRLIPEEMAGESRAARMYFSQGWTLSRETRNPAWAFVKNEKLGLLPVALRAGKDLWRDSTALLAAVPAARGAEQVRPAALGQAARLVERGVLERAQAVRCVACGLANAKAKPLFWRREEWPVPAGLLEDEETSTALAVALAAADAGNSAVYAACSRFSDRLKGGFAEVRDRAMASYWAALEPEFRRLLAGLGAAEEGALPAWSAALVASARDAYRTHTAQAQRALARHLEAAVQGEAILERKLKTVRIDGEGGGANGDA